MATCGRPCGPWDSAAPRLLVSSTHTVCAAQRTPACAPSSPRQKSNSPWHARRLAGGGATRRCWTHRKRCTAPGGQHCTGGWSAARRAEAPCLWLSRHRSLHSCRRTTATCHPPANSVHRKAAWSPFATSPCRAHLEIPTRNTHKHWTR
jgi:hypothetical protein